MTNMTYTPTEMNPVIKGFYCNMTSVGINLPGGNGKLTRSSENLGQSATLTVGVMLIVGGH